MTETLSHCFYSQRKERRGYYGRFKSHRRWNTGNNRKSFHTTLNE